MKTTPHELKNDPEYLRLKRVILPIVATSNNLEFFDPIGTTFIIHHDGKQALALTAAHNIHEIAKIDCPYDLHHPTTLPEFIIRPKEINLRDTSMRVLYPDMDGKIYAVKIVKAYALDDSDIAVCVLGIESTLPSNLVFDQQLKIDSAVPQRAKPCCFWL
jgi:hypothetical protein